MIGALEPLGTSMVKLALDAAALRHQALAQNVANLHSENYVPLDVSFDAQLEALRRGRKPAPLEVVAQPGVDAGPRPQDADVELAAITENAIHYQALLKALGVRMAIVGSVIADGRSA